MLGWRLHLCWPLHISCRPSGGQPIYWRPCFPAFPKNHDSLNVTVDVVFCMCSMMLFQAVKVYTKALEKIPRYKEAHVNIGQAYKDLANLPFALKHFNKVCF